MTEAKYLPTFEQFIQEFGKPVNEEKERDSKKKYPYGCSMLYFDFPDMKIIHDEIEEDDIFEGEDQGLETEPHVTLLYGLHSDEIDDQKVLDISSKGIKSLGLGNVSLFENEKYDVLKFDVEGPFLHDINKELTKLPHTTDFPDYHPHCTIAYLKPGTGKKYTKQFKGRIIKVVFFCKQPGVIYILAVHIICKC